MTTELIDQLAALVAEMRSIDLMGDPSAVWLGVTIEKWADRLSTIIDAHKASGTDQPVNKELAAQLITELRKFGNKDVFLDRDIRAIVSSMKPLYIRAASSTAPSVEVTDDLELNLIGAQGIADRALGALLTCRRLVHKGDKLARHLVEGLVSSVVDPLGETSRPISPHTGSQHPANND
jgi:predicted component of viral defense system (DUF524 family)